MKKLYPHQERLILDTREAIAEGHRQVILVSPTGSGKAVTLAELARLHLSKGGTKVLVVAHRRELIEQLYDTFQDQTGLPVSAIMTSASRLQFNPHRQLQIASVQSLLAREELPDVSLVILDEVHHHISDEWAKIHRTYPRVLTIGATATPCRSDGRAFGDWGFTKLIEGPTTEELTNLGLLAPMDVVAPSRVLKHKQVAMHPLDALRAHAPDRKRIIIFAPNTATAEQYVADFTAAGITSAFISYKSPDRAQMLKRFKSGDLRVLVNLALVSEGFDEPAVDCLINCRSIGSIGLWRQALGRGLRIAPGKESCTLIDLVGVINLHGDHLEPLEYSLEGEGVRRARDPNAVRFCRVCSAIVEGTGLICEDCNIGPAAQVVPTVSGDKLQRFARIRKQDDSQRKITYTRWLKEADDAGKQLGSVYYKFKHVYDCEPPREWLNEYKRSKRAV